MAELHLIVNGKRYAGWETMRVTRSVESLSGSFDLEVSDRWSHDTEPWPIREEDACRVEIDGETVLDGYVDRRHQSMSATSATFRVSGRDRAAAIVDCSAVLDKFSFRNATVVDVARKVAAPFGVKVSVQPGLELLKAPTKLVVSPGDTGWQVIERAARPAGVMVVSDGAGGLMITRSGVGRAASLVQGENIEGGSVDYDAGGRFSRYIVATQVGGTDESSGGAVRIRAEATDESVRRSERVLLIRPESGVPTDYARQRADWEARIRAARAEAVTITVIGWKQPDGRLWPLNHLALVRAPWLGVDGDMLITQAEHTVGAGGEMTSLRLIRPDAFTPEPKIAKVKKSGTTWKKPVGLKGAIDRGILGFS